MLCTAEKRFSQTRPALHCHLQPAHHDSMPPQVRHPIRTMSNKGTSSIAPLREPTLPVLSSKLQFKACKYEKDYEKEEEGVWEGSSTVLSWVGLLDTCRTLVGHNLEHLRPDPCSARNVLSLRWHHSSEFQKERKKGEEKKSKLGTLSPYPDNTQKLRGLWQASIMISRPTFIYGPVHGFEGNALCIRYFP